VRPLFVPPFRFVSRLRASSLPRVLLEGTPMRSHKSIILAAMLLAIASSTAAPARAKIITQIVEFATPTTGSPNQLAVVGKLNTLSQAIGVVGFGNTSVDVSGLLRAALTLDIPREGDIEILGFELLESNFTQSGVNLFYDVPNTDRRVTFSATDLQFAVQFGVSTNNQQPLTTASNIPADSYQMVQNAGTAQVGITNRPSVTQNLYQQSVLSTYQGSQSIERASFAIAPPSNGSDQSLIALSLPLSNQQLHYAGVGLPVTLTYSGTLNLVGTLPLVSNQIPEPGALLLVGGTLLMLTFKRPGVTIPARIRA
jgi:hypothetical protein